MKYRSMSRRKRRALGLTPSARTRFKWTPEADALLGTDTDANIAEMLSPFLSRAQVRRRRLELDIPVVSKIDWAEHDGLLGTASDAEVAEMIGPAVSPETVRQRRLALGVEAFQQQSPRAEWTPEMDRLLGLMPDRVVAERLGLTLTQVFARRKKLGKKAFYRG